MANSFIANVNALAQKLDAIVESNEIFNDGVIPILEEIAALDLQEAVSDLKKGNYLGNRKIDINLSLNMIGITEDSTADEIEVIWTNPVKTVLYDNCDVLFVDGVNLNIPFLFDGNPTTISTHGDLLIQLNANAAFLAKLEDTLISGFATAAVGEIVRVYDVIGSNSNIERITLNATTGDYKEQRPVYYWAKTTSAFQTLSMRAGDIIKIGNEIDNVILLANSIEQLIELQSRIPQLVDTFTGETPNGDVTIYNKLDELQAIYDVITEILAVYAIRTNVTTVAGSITSINSVATNVVPNLIELLDVNNQSALAIAANSAAQLAKTAAEAAATTATTKNNEIKAVSVDQTITGAAGTNASVIYNPTTGKFTFVVPQGLQGLRGEAFSVDATGLFAQRITYDAQPTNFSFLATDIGFLYFKKSNTSGDWSDGIPFGKGEQGDPGVSITGIARTSGTGAAGTTDTYTIYYSDATTSTFEIYNGADGAVMSVAGRSGNVVLTKADVGLANVDNTADVDKPVSTAMQLALDDKSDDTHSHIAFTGLTVTGLKETSVAMVANDINLATGNLFTKTISGATTLTVSNVPASGTAQSFILELTNGGSGAITWFSGAKFTKGTPPTLTASGRDVIGCYTLDGGTTWNVLVLGLDVK